MPSMYCGKKESMVKGSQKQSRTKSGKLRKMRRSHKRTYCYSTVNSGDDDVGTCMVGKSERCVRRGNTPQETEKLEARREKSRSRRKSHRGGSRRKSQKGGGASVCLGLANPKSTEVGAKKCLPPCTWKDSRNITPHCATLTNEAKKLNNYEELKTAQAKHADEFSKYLDTLPKSSQSTGHRGLQGQPPPSSVYTDTSSDDDYVKYDTSDTKKYTADQRRNLLSRPFANPTVDELALPEGSDARNALVRDRKRNKEAYLEKLKGYGKFCEVKNDEADCVRTFDSADNTNTCKWTKGYTRKDGVAVRGSCHAHNEPTIAHENACAEIKDSTNCGNKKNCYWDDYNCRAFNENVARGPAVAPRR